MGRAGVTYSEISNAAEDLAGQGKNPTVDTVREVLGTGSKSTIAPLLKQWRKDKEHGFSGAGDLPSELVLTVKGLYKQLHDQAQIPIQKIQTSLDEERQQHTTKIQEIMVFKKNIEGNLEQAHTTIDQKQNEISKLTKELEKKSLQLAKTDETLVGSIQQNDTLKGQLSEMRTQIKQVQGNLEHFREASQQQLNLIQSESDKRESQFLHDKQQLQLLLENSEMRQRELQQRIANVEEKCDQLSKENANYVSKNAEVIIKYNKALEEIETQKKCIESLKTKMTDKQQKNEKLEARYVQSKTLIDELKTAHIGLSKEKEIEMRLRMRLEDQLNTLKQNHDELLSNNGALKEKLHQILVKNVKSKEIDP